MHHAAAQVQQLPGLKGARVAVGGNGQAPRQALHRDVAGHLVRWKRLARPQHQADDFQLGGLEQGLGARGGQVGRHELNAVAGGQVGDCHGGCLLG